MSLRSRLRKLESLAPGPDRSDPWWDDWLWFRNMAFEVLEEGGFTEALALVKMQVAGNEPHVFPGRGPILRNGHDVRLWVMTETVWGAVHDYPAAEQSLNDALGDAKALEEACRAGASRKELLDLLQQRQRERAQRAAEATP